MFYADTIDYLTWQEFERNTARLLMSLEGWDQVQLVGRSGDGGADVLATHEGELCLFQCKHTTPKKEAITEVRNAGTLYGADRLFVVSSQEAGTDTDFSRELNRLKYSFGLPIDFVGPADLLRYTEDAPERWPHLNPLREYQEAAIDALEISLNDSGKANLVMATGLGKTYVAAELVASLIENEQLEQNRVLVLAHGKELIHQLSLAFWRHLPKDIETHRLSDGERPNNLEGVTFATRQAMAGYEEPIYFDMVIVDEAHHLGIGQYSDILRRLEPPKLLGMTATPWRGDKISIEPWIGPPVFSMGIKEGLAEGHLSNVDYKLYLDGIDWAFVKQQSEYGYTIKDLNTHLIIPTRDEEAIREIRRVFDTDNRTRGIVFSPSQEHARRFASELRKFGLSAQPIVSDTDRFERYRSLSDFASGKLQFLCSVDIFNEGIDVPDVDMVVFMRKTHSRRIFIQQLGRGLRVATDKDKLVVLDFVADIRRIHAALDLGSGSGISKEIETLLLSNAHVGFGDKSMGDFFYEWIADLGTYSDKDINDLVKLPTIDPNDPRFNYPEDPNDPSGDDSDTL